MNSDTLQGKWRQLRGNIKEAFGKLTDDDLLQADGNTDKMLGVLQERYGYNKAQAEQAWNQFAQKHMDRADDAKADINAAVTDLKAAGNHLKDVTKR